MAKVRPAALVLRDCGISKSDLEDICDFSGRKRVRFHEVDLSYNYMMSGGGAQIANLLLKIPHHPAGSSLNLSHCNLTASDIQDMAKAVKEGKEIGKLNVRKLDLSYNTLTHGGEAIADILRYMPEWSEVDLSNCMLISSDIAQVSMAFSDSGIQGLRLDLSHNNVSGAGKSICSLMKTNKYFNK